MQTVSTIGLDIAKSVFQVHGIDAAGQVVIRRQLKASISALVDEAQALTTAKLGPRKAMTHRNTAALSQR